MFVGIVFQRLLWGSVKIRSFSGTVHPVISFIKKNDFMAFLYTARYKPFPSEFEII